MIPSPFEMSIQPTSVLRRIVEDARANPHPDFACEVLAPEAFRPSPKPQRVSWLRAPIGGFATEFEFWAHALHVWLARVGVPERFEAIVGNALCEQVSEAELRRHLAARLEGSREPHRLEITGTFAGAYRMLEQDVIVSYTIETDAEQIAFFWEDMDWL